MGRYPGELTTDVYGEQIEEYKLGLLLDLSAAQAADLDANGILVEHETSATLVTTATTFLAQPPQARQLTAIVKAADASEVTADATITFYGKNKAGKAISDVLTFTANLGTALTTAKAFASVDRIVFSAQADGTPAFDIGWNEVIGLPMMFASVPVFFEIFNGALQTAGTFTADADELEKNVYDPTGNLDGAKTLKLFAFI
jgi:hypothetical protein